MRRGGLRILWGEGGTFFPNLKRGVTFFFQSLILNIFLKKVCNTRNQSASCTVEPLFVSLSNTTNTDLQRFCLIHKPHSSILKDLFINKYCTLFLFLQNLCPKLSSHLHHFFKLNHDPAKRPKRLTVLAKGTNYMSSSSSSSEAIPTSVMTKVFSSLP